MTDFSIKHLHYYYELVDHFIVVQEWALILQELKNGCPVRLTKITQHLPSQIKNHDRSFTFRLGSFTKFILCEMEAEPRLKIVAVSDTHSHFDQFEQLIRENIKGDIFVCAGDFTRYGREEHFSKFFSLLERLPFRHKIVIAGNHEIALDPFLDPKQRGRMLEKYPCRFTREDILTELRKRCVYLQHELVEIQGIRIFGSPHTQYYSKGAFQYRLEQDHHVWSTLPHPIDLLITHSPPLGILDKTCKDKNAGSKALRVFVESINPKLHIFGHIHESHGVVKKGPTTFMNVAKKYQIFEWE